MTNIRIESYSEAHKRAWDSFVDAAKNGAFLFKRDYMNYHAERFPDASLMFFFDDSDELIAVLPATSSDGEILSSHAGLTFGGIVSGNAMKIASMLNVFDVMVTHARQAGFRQLIYKAVPHIYHRAPAEEDLYALFRHDARLVRRDVSATIDMRERLPFGKGRKWALKQAKKAGLEVGRSFDFATFMSIEEQLLDDKYGARPVHSVSEIELLASRFPDNIKLFAARSGEAMLAGVVIYENAEVAHAQYIGASEEGRRRCALDLIMDHLINDYYALKRYFDFGISTENGGRHLNNGLAENKQSYGARAVVYDFYELDLST